MRITVRFDDRVGIAQEILGVLALKGINVVAVEVDVPFVYIDAPALPTDAFHALRDELAAVAGVTHVRTTDQLPGMRRRLHLEALLSAMPDPVLLLDGEGVIVVGNAAAAAAAGTDERGLEGLALDVYLADDEDMAPPLVAAGFRMAPREVSVRGEPFLLTCTPALDAEGQPAGGVVTLQAPNRVGEQMHVLQHFRPGSFEAILGASPAIAALRRQGARVAALDAPLLILGETGTGKELVALACHAGSPRKEAPFLALNCAAVPESLAESELFGYAPGAFSGAQKGGKPGLLELAGGGTVFLDEIGEMSPYLQAKLLRFLNDGSFRRVGGDRELRVDVRIIGATHRDLAAMVRDGSFREDLFYRLNVLRLEVPPLRKRGDDILTLARHFMEEAAARAGRPCPALSPAARAGLLASPWPGNVRQLQNVVFRAVTMTEKTVLEPADLELADELAGGQGADPGTALPPPGPGPATWEDAQAAFERDLLARLYPLFPSSRKLAARLSTSHTMIANKLRRYGIPEKP